MSSICNLNGKDQRGNFNVPSVNVL